MVLARPTSIVPAPRMISVPASCPNNVLSELNAAFGLFWIDYSASLNRIRIALEMILTDLGIKRSSVPRSGTSANAAPSAKKRVRLNLHQRIELLKNKKPQLTNIFERMMAVKHLGNAGSHSGTAVVIDDVFDGLDILEKILQDLYSEDPKILTKTVMQINKHKGPRKKPQN